MAIKIKKNGKIENFTLHSTDVKVLDLEGKFKKKDLESVIREISDTEHIHIGEADISKDGIWINDEEILDDSDSNGVVEQLKEYVDKQVGDRSKLINLVNVEVDFNELEDGRYLVNTSKESLKNAPTSVSHGGILTVNKCSDGLSQILISDEGRVYYRRKWYVYWGEWNELMSSNQISNPNLLINGDFQVWQRGTNFNTGGYTADRWFVSQGRTEKTTLNYKNALKITRTSANTNETNMCYNLEGLQEMRGKTYTLSWKSSVNVDLDYSYLIYSSSNDVIVIADGSKRYSANTINSHSITFTIPTNLDTKYQVLTLRVLRYCKTFDHDITISDIKLEQGSVATPFVPRLYGEELALCKRYYEITDPDTEFLGSRTNHDTFTFTYRYPIPKRVGATVKFSHAGNSDNVLFMFCDGTVGHKSCTIQKSIDTEVKWVMNVSTGNPFFGQGASAFGRIIADAEIY